jgi:MOSC domain-containing protein YiiM
MNNLRIIKLGIVPENTKQAVYVKTTEFVAGKGMVGDKHYGDAERQVCILLKASADWRDSQPEDQQGLCFRKFKENILIDGVEPGGLRPGDSVQLGDAELVIDGFKNCYAECPIYDNDNDCVLKLGGYFASVTKSGTAKAVMQQ